MAKIRIDGRWYEWNDSTISARRLKEACQIDPTRSITYTTQNMRDGATLQENEEIPIDKAAVLQATTFPNNSVYGAVSMGSLTEQDFRNLAEREKFILAQVLQVAERYFFRNKNALILGDKCDFLVIRDFPIPPAGGWKARNASLCIYFPKTYPRKAPVGFFIDANLQKRNRDDSHLFHGSAIYTEPDAFYQKHGLYRKGYGFYCWHVEDNWKPDLTNPLRPDNLDSFLKIAYFALDEKSVTGRRMVSRIW